MLSGILKVILVVYLLFIATGLTQTLTSYIVFLLEKMHINGLIKKHTISANKNGSFIPLVRNLSGISYRVLGLYSFSMLGGLFTEIRKSISSDPSFISYAFILPLVILFQYYTLQEWKKSKADADNLVPSSSNYHWESTRIFGMTTVFSMSTFITFSFIYFSIFDHHIPKVFFGLIEFMMRFIVN